MTIMPDERAENITIIRRSGHGADEHHHGGVWKIAYADFMTAMMAFFLVMWLINASNTETRASVASYFNPVKLTDTASRSKGLQDGGGKAAAKHDKGDATEIASASKRMAGPAETLEPAAANTAIEKQGLASGSRNADVILGGPAFSDPYISPKPQPAEAPAIAREENKIFSAPKDTIAQPQSADANSQAAAARKSMVEKPEQRLKAAEATANRIRRSVQNVVQQLGILGGPDIDVTIEGETVVLNISDTSTFGMFRVGSTEPSDALLQIVQRLAPIINMHGERVILRGHTDARPFRTESGSNNWRLSMARAEVAAGLLIKAGFDEGRLERIEAHADRMPAVAGDPEAARNRRIQILLRQPAR